MLSSHKTAESRHKVVVLANGPAAPSGSSAPFDEPEDFDAKFLDEDEFQEGEEDEFEDPDAIPGSAADDLGEEDEFEFEEPSPEMLAELQGTWGVARAIMQCR